MYYTIHCSRLLNLAQKVSGLPSDPSLYPGTVYISQCVRLPAALVTELPHRHPSGMNWRIVHCTALHCTALHCDNSALYSVNCTLYRLTSTLSMYITTALVKVQKTKASRLPLACDPPPAQSNSSGLSLSLQPSPPYCHTDTPRVSKLLTVL